LVRSAYVNGRYLPGARATVHIEDRGYQFSDGVYEVCEVRDSHIIDGQRHMARLRRSLAELRIPMPMSDRALGIVMRECLLRNRVRDGIIYLQITRGVARRDHAFPAPDTKPSLVVTARSLDRAANERIAVEGVAVVTVPDNRWERVDIKSISLLPNVLAKQAAREQGAKEAWFVDSSGHVTEGSSSNAWIVTIDGKVVTRPADQGLSLEERAFTPQEAYKSREAFLTSASQVVVPVVRIDGRAVGNGAPGLVATALRAKFHEHAGRS
jgi:D-alanine transaminase